MTLDARCVLLRSAVWHAAQKGNVPLLRLLFSYGAEMEEPDSLGLTPFSVACVKGHVQVVDFFYKHCPGCGTDLITLASGEVWPPIFFAVAYGRISVTQYILERLGLIGLSYRDRDGRNAVLLALASGALSLAKSILNRVLSFNSVEAKSRALDLIVNGTTDGTTSLWVAAYVGDSQGIAWILDILHTCFKKSPIEIRQFVCQSDSRSITPLQMAIASDNLQCCRILIRNGADVDCYNPGNFLRGNLTLTGPPILQACAHGDLDMIKVLVHAGARRRGDTICITVASQMGNRHVVRYLQSTRGYCSRLHYMTEIPEDVILDLLRAGADIHCTHEEEFYRGIHAEEYGGVSPLDVASKIHHDRIASGLEVPKAVGYILSASEPWTPETHAVFDKASRALAVNIFSILAYPENGGMPREIWLQLIIPFAVIRMDPPLSRSDANLIRRDSL